MERNTPGVGGDQFSEYSQLPGLQEIKSRISKRGEDICCARYDRILTAIEAESLSKREKEREREDRLCLIFYVKVLLNGKRATEEAVSLVGGKAHGVRGAPSQPRRHCQQTLNTKKFSYQRHPQAQI